MSWWCISVFYCLSLCVSADLTANRGMTYYIYMLVCTNTLVSCFCEAPQSNLIKLFKIHLSVAVQIKHFEGNLEIPLRSWTQTHTHTKSEINAAQYKNMHLNGPNGSYKSCFWANSHWSAKWVPHNHNQLNALLSCSTNDSFSRIFLFKY